MSIFVIQQDPSVQQAAGNNAARVQQGLEEYNPFDESQQVKNTPVFIVFSQGYLLFTGFFIYLTIICHFLHTGQANQSTTQHPACPCDISRTVASECPSSTYYSRISGRNVTNHLVTSYLFLNLKHRGGRRNLKEKHRNCRDVKKN
jgi:hypothetical protein